MQRRASGSLVLIMVAVLAVTIGAAILLLTDGGAASRSEEARSDPTPIDGDVTVITGLHPSLPDPVWDEAAELERCKTAPVEELGYPSESFLAYDTATRKNFTANARKACRQSVPLTPDPGGDMGAAFYFANGNIAADYCEREVSPGSEVCTQRIPDAEAAARLALQKEARKN